MKAKRTERGWAGHFICADRCRFRRNTLIEYYDTKIVISTVGLMVKLGKVQGFDTVGHNRYFETMAFHTEAEDKRFYDADVCQEVAFNADWSISEIDADDKANDMHEAVVDEIMAGLENGLRYDTDRD